MKWNHLPVAGGLYDQHPKLLADWEILFSAIHRKDERDAAEQADKAKAGRKG